MIKISLGSPICSTGKISRLAPISRSSSSTPPMFVLRKVKIIFLVWNLVWFSQIKKSKHGLEHFDMSPLSCWSKKVEFYFRTLLAIEVHLYINQCQQQQKQPSASLRSSVQTLPIFSKKSYFKNYFFEEIILTSATGVDKRVH